MSSPREREKRDRRDCSGDKREGQERKREMNEIKKRRNKNSPSLPLPDTGIEGLAQL